MLTGTVQFYDHNRGYGYIRPHDGTANLIVHDSALDDAELRTIEEGQIVSYEEQHGSDGSRYAVNLRVL